MTDALALIQEYGPQALAAVGGVAGVAKAATWAVHRVVDAWRNGMPLWRALRFHAQLVWRRWRDDAPDASPHRVTRLECGMCGDRWVGVVPVSDGKVHRIYWECAFCNAMTAREVQP